MRKCVINPAPRLITRVAAKRHIANSHPKVLTVRRKISGSMDGDANQNVITGARGTPPISSAAITGITEQEHNGLNAPTNVARKMAVIGRAVKARLMYLEAPDIFTQ
jgi:hypothetical protein